MIKEFTNAEILNILGGINTPQTMEKAIDKMNTRSQWALRKNIKKLSSLQDLYNEMNQDIENKYIDDEHSENKIQKNENGEEITTRVVKDEFLQEFTQQRLELLNQKNEIDISLIEIDDVPEHISFENLNMLSFMINEED